MAESFFKYKLQKLLQDAGITIDGKEPWDIRVHDDRFYRRVLTEAHLGTGESYMDDWWDCEALDEFFYRVLRKKLDRQVSGLPRFIGSIAGKILNLQHPRRAFTVGETHYNIGNDLYGAMLDKRMIYSCGYWDGARDLDEAQERKLRLVFDKLMLEPGMHLLDIGCGYCSGFPIEIKLMDYRDLSAGTFDRIYSIGMFEHVGHKNYRTYFQKARNALDPKGLFLLHTIGSNRTGTNTDRWTSRYIFPNSMLPSADHIARTSEGTFVLEDWHSFGYDYFLTLKAWNENIERHRITLGKNYSERFFRMWRYYLLSAAGSFRARHVQLWQVLFSPAGVEGLFRVQRTLKEKKRN